VQRGTFNREARKVTAGGLGGEGRGKSYATEGKVGWLGGGEQEGCSRSKIRGGGKG